uniref:Reverse transcriptase domain-containing protein n=1 Tax=Tanacetum cinerariifolium TaxID=118510 RepID=A0A699LB87_TANCI|nr:reverse transcriptase domain-containing protein [Tanacetum cinerariifolium]
MRTRSSSNLPVVSPNPSTSNLKRRNRRRSKQPFILEESPIDTMVDQRTNAELLRAPTEGYAEAIVVPQFLLSNSSSSTCLAADGNTFLELKDNIHGYVSVAAVNYNQGNYVYRPPGMANQIQPPGFAQPNVQNNQNRVSQPQGYNRGNNFNPEQSYQAPTQQNQVVPLNELEKVKRINEANMKAMQTQINIVKNKLRNEMKNSIQASLSNQTNEIKNIMASLFQMNTASTSGSGSLPSNTVANLKGKLKAITTRSGLVLDGPTVSTPPPFINPEEDERVEKTLTDQDLSEYTIKVPFLLSKNIRLRLKEIVLCIKGILFI